MALHYLQERTQTLTPGQGATSNQYTLMPDASMVHDIATPRRLVEDAASGASVHSLPQGNAKVLPAVCAEHDSLTVKHVSSNGVIAKPTITTYMHTVSTGVSGMIMNCSQKQTADQDAVDAVTRQRDTITRTAADTEVLLPFAQDSDQA